jgi:hypothetical protein
MELTAGHAEILEELADLIRAMGPYRQDAVVSGGVVPLIYRFHSNYKRPRQPALLTNDLDLTVPESLPFRERRLRDELDHGGFVVVPSRTSNPSLPPKHVIQRKALGERTVAALHGELLIPLTGSAIDRKNRPRSPREIQDGLTAEALRFLDLLLWEPVTFDLAHIEDLQLKNGGLYQVKLPRIGPYIVQKALCSERRENREKRDKDLAYIYDAATIAHGNWSSIRREVKELSDEKTRWHKWLREAIDILQKAFLSESPIGPEAVERTYENASVQARTVSRVMSAFIEAVTPLEAP